MSDSGVREAIRAARLPRRAPDDDDRPTPRAFPGKRVPLVKGQLDLEGNEYHANGSVVPRAGLWR